MRVTRRSGRSAGRPDGTASDQVKHPTLGPARAEAMLPRSDMLNHEIRNLEELKPSRRNSKRHPENQISLLMQSLSDFGWTMPILVDADGEIIAGHGIFEAARRIREQGAQIPGWPDTSTVPVVVNDRLTEAQRRAYRIADNRLAELGRWDEEALAEELKALEDAGATLLTTGFSEDEVAAYIAGADLEGGDDEPRPEVEFSEELLLEHNYVVLYFDNPLDWQVAVDKFGLRKVKDLIPRKGQPTGIGRVLRGAEWLPRIR